MGSYRPGVASARLAVVRASHGHIKEALEHKGFAVVIAKHPCMLKFMRDQRARIPGFKPEQVQVDQETCDNSRVCIRDFGCPSFMTNDDGSVSVHPDLCIGDGSCIQTCPVNAIVRKQAGGEQ